MTESQVICCQLASDPFTKTDQNGLKVPAKRLRTIALLWRLEGAFQADLDYASPIDIGAVFSQFLPTPTQMALKFGGGSASPLVKCRSAIG